MTARALFLPVFGLVAGLAILACQSRAQTASENLRDAVVTYNDALRFGRMDLALERVSGGQRATFAGAHYRWGRTVEIADYEIVNVEAAGEEMERAVSYVTVRWIARGTMLMRETLLRQEWEKSGGQYQLMSETVVDGDADLLAIPEGFRPEISGLIEPTPDAGPADAAGPDAGVPPTAD